MHRNLLYSYTLTMKTSERNDYTTQGNLQIQCNLYQVANGIFHRTRTKKSQNLFGDTKDPKQPKQYRTKQSKKKKELEESGSLTSGYTTKLQSSKQCEAGTKVDIQINGTEWKTQK